jgi:chorismate mutase
MMMVTSNASQPRIRAVRGATTLPEDTAETMQIEVAKVIEALVKQNSIQADDIVSVFFTLTEDLHSVSPAKVTRRVMGWKDVALFSAVEPRIEGQPEKAVRILIQFYTTRRPSQLVHLYYNEARHLRPDRSNASSQATAPMGSANVVFDDIPSLN